MYDLILTKRGHKTKWNCVFSVLINLMLPLLSVRGEKAGFEMCWGGGTGTISALGRRRTIQFPVIRISDLGQEGPLEGRGTKNLRAAALSARSGLWSAIGNLPFRNQRRTFMTKVQPDPGLNFKSAS